MHFIVCGMGHVGYRAVRLLLGLGATVSVITTKPNSEWVDVVTEAGVTVVEGDARNRRLLIDAGLERADAVLAVTNHDLVNIEVALDAKRIRPDVPVVVRLFDQSLARQVEATFDIRRAMAMSALAAPSFVAAIVGEGVTGTFRLDEQLWVIGRSDAREGTLKSEIDVDSPELWRDHGLLRFGSSSDGEVKLGDESESGKLALLLGTAASWDKATATPQIVARRTGLAGAAWNLRHANPMGWLRVLKALWENAPAVLRWAVILLAMFFASSVFIFHRAMNLSFVDAIYFVTETVTTVGYGDISPHRGEPQLKIFAVVLMILGSASIAVMYSLITDFIVTSRLEQIAGTRGVPRHDHVVVVGLGNVGLRIVEELLRAKADVVVIERDGENDFVEAVRPHTPVIVGDARTQETRQKVDLRRAAAVIAATDDDVVNLGVCLAAKEMNSKARTIARFFDGEFAQKIEGKLNIDVALSAADIAAPHFVASALESNAVGAFAVGKTFVILALEKEGKGRSEKSAAIPLLTRRGGAFQRCTSEPAGAGEERLVAIVRRLA
jgi:Trk K+ transport system NAD-binding subunit